MQDMDTFDFLVSEFRSDRLSYRDLDYAFKAWREMDRGELRATLRPYVARHAKQILNMERKYDTTSVLWEKLCGDSGQGVELCGFTRVNGKNIDWAAARGLVRRAIKEDGEFSLKVELVHGMTSEFVIDAEGIVHDVRNLMYTPQWSYDQAVEVGEGIIADMTREFEGEEPAAAWGWFRALVRTLALSDIDWNEGYLHETYEQASYQNAVSSAEHAMICEVAAALHPDISYTAFFSCVVDSPESTMINSLAGILGEYVQTEESNGDIYASLSITRGAAHDVLNQLTELALAWGNDPEDAPGIARSTLCEWSDAERYLD